MWYSQSYHEDAPSIRLRPTISLTTYIEHTIAISHSPFADIHPLLRLKKSLLIKVAAWFERVFSCSLYVEDDNTLLYQLSPETRALLSWLIKKKVLETWYFMGTVPGFPRTKVLILRPTPISDPSGGNYVLTGANGVGTGSTYQAAAYPALGEFIERLASSAYWWEDKQLFRASYEPKKKFLAPHKLVHLNTEQVHNLAMQGKYLPTADTNDCSLVWKTATELQTGKTVYVPAALCYIFSEQGMADNPFFPDVTSNGVATHQSYDEAVVRATLEYIERDFIIRAWYHRKVGRRINLQSLSEKFPVAAVLLRAQSVGIRTYLIELQDDLPVATVVGVRMVEHADSRAVHFTAAAGLNFDEAIEKTLRELTRFANSNYQKDDNLQRESCKTMQKDADSIVGRGKVWSSQSMIKHIEWFVTGREVSYDELLAEQSIKHRSVKNPAARLNIIKEISQQHNLRIYHVRLTNSIARHAGLEVARVITPDLLPMFFNEQYIPLAHPRLVSKMITVDELNPVPHPFL